MNPETLISDDAPIPLIIASPDMNALLWANQAAQEWIGLSLRSLVKKTLAEIFREPTSIIKAGHRSRAGMAPVSLYNLELRDVGDTAETGHITLFPTGANIGLMVQPHGTQPNQSSNADFAASAMGRMLAHEIKNPLAGIDGAAQLLALDLEGEENLDLIDLIRSEIKRIRRLADRMESLGDSNPENATPINIHTLLAKARLVVQNAEGDDLSIVENYDPSLPPVIGDEDTLMQALLNLIKNAAESIKSTEKPGQITLETSFRSGVTRRNSQSGITRQLPIEIRIIDNGPGVSEDVRGRLFQPFVTNKPSGQGLGLALVSKVASAHGGFVEITSQPGRTVFSILLPADLPKDT